MASLTGEVNNFKSEYEEEDFISWERGAHPRNFPLDPPLPSLSFQLLTANYLAMELQSDMVEAIRD